MAITKYTITLRLEYSDLVARDAITAKIKTFITNEKAGGSPITSASLDREEYTKPDRITETL